MAKTSIEEVGPGTSVLPVSGRMLVENASGLFAVWLRYTEELLTPFRGHELKPGERVWLEGDGPVYAQADAIVHLVISR